jgi:hypothetical protein
LLLVLLGSPARADELSAVIQRHIAWRGGAAFEAMTSLHQTGEVTASGLSGPYQRWSDRSGRSRDDLDLGVIKQVSAYAGPTGWVVNQSGQVEAASVHAVRDARRAAVLEFAPVLHGKGASLSLLPDRTRDGRAWAVVRIDFRDDDRYELFLDRETGALHGLRTVQDRRERFTTFEDWRIVSGVRVAFRSATTSDLKSSDTTTVFSRIVPGAPLTKALFVSPKSARAAVFANGARSTGWMTFNFFSENRIFIPALVHGRPVQVLLDSGAESTILDKTWAEMAGLKEQGAVTTLGTGGADTAGLIGGVDIQMGDLALKNLTVGTLDLGSIGARIGRPLPVILGKEVFNELIVDIDFANRRIAFHDPAAFTPPAGAMAVPLKAAGGLRTVAVSVEGANAIDVDFDLGNGSPLLLYPAYWKPAGLLESRPSSQTLSGAVGGLRAQPIATIRDVRIGAVDIRDVPTVMTLPGASGVDSDRTLGNVGLPILSRFRVITDYGHDRLYLIPQTEALALPFVKDRLGLSLEQVGGEIVVEFVAPGSPAEATGFKPHDRIRTIDRKPPEAWPIDALRSLKNSPAGSRVEFEMADGEVRRVRLADYF